MLVHLAVDGDGGAVKVQGIGAEQENTVHTGAAIPNSGGSVGRFHVDFNGTALEVTDTLAGSGLAVSGCANTQTDNGLAGGLDVEIDLTGGHFQVVDIQSNTPAAHGESVYLNGTAFHPEGSVGIVVATDNAGAGTGEVHVQAGVVLHTKTAAHTSTSKVDGVFDGFDSDIGLVFEDHFTLTAQVEQEIAGGLNRQGVRSGSAGEGDLRSSTFSGVVDHEDVAGSTGVNNVGADELHGQVAGFVQNTEVAVEVVEGQGTGCSVKSERTGSCMRYGRCGRIEFGGGSAVNVHGYGRRSSRTGGEGERTNRSDNKDRRNEDRECLFHGISPFFICGDRAALLWYNYSIMGAVFQEVFAIFNFS